MRIGMQASQAVLPHTINEDFFAAMLSGEKRLGHRMVHLPSEGFWFLDPKVGLFCPTTDQKVELLVSNYMVKCAEAMGGNVDSGPLLTVHRRSSVLSSIVKRARSVLEAEPRFFEGAGAPQRFLQGRILAPVASSSPAEFINRAIEPLPGGRGGRQRGISGFSPTLPAREPCPGGVLRLQKDRAGSDHGEVSVGVAA